MNRFVKNAIGIGFAVLVVGVACFAIFGGSEAKAQGNLTNGGTLTGTVASLKSATSVWWEAYEDQSTYPSPNSRHGTIVRLYDFSKDGGAVSTISLEKGNVVTNIPDNTIIWDGYVEIMTPMTPAGVTNSLGVNTAADILGSTSTNLRRAVGVYDLIPDGSAVNAVKLTNNMPFDLTMTGTTAATAGVFQVVLDVYYGQ